jgi:phage-related protein
MKKRKNNVRKRIANRLVSILSMYHEGTIESAKNCLIKADAKGIPDYQNKEHLRITFLICYSRYGPMPERIFYASWSDNRYVLLSHYTKKQNATDPRQVDRALNLLDDWLNRKETTK